LPSGAKVYNPFAGLASFGVFLDGGQHYFGQEYNSTTWAIGYLRILAYELEGLTDCRYELFPIKSIYELTQIIRNNPGIEGLNVTVP